MIKIKKKINSIPPDILIVQGKKETDSLKLEYDKGVRSFEFKSSIYGHEDVKASLVLLQDKKCCFCESKTTHVAYGDVEHYRPKGGWIQEKEKLNQPGYYWLAYEWDNLMFSCQICNQRFKKNLFPLQDGSIRVNSHHGKLSDESPVFIHPVFDNPEDHISFSDEIPIWGNSYRGEKTVKSLGLDREDLNEMRRTTLARVRKIYKLAKGYPDTTSELKKEAKEYILEEQELAERDDTQFASMLRCFFKKNPIDF
jgi:uncharacterized protein (TIGR02646 family)